MDIDKDLLNISNERRLEEAKQHLRDNPLPDAKTAELSRVGTLAIRILQNMSPIIDDVHQSVEGFPSFGKVSTHDTILALYLAADSLFYRAAMRHSEDKRKLMAQHTAFKRATVAAQCIDDIMGIWDKPTDDKPGITPFKTGNGFFFSSGERVNGPKREG